MKRILLMILVIGVLMLSACGSPNTDSSPEAPNQPGFTHYVNADYGFSVDYPTDWIFEEVDPGTIGIKPEESSYNQIMISANVGGLAPPSTPEIMISVSTEASLRQFFEALGFTELTIITNEPATEKWDWVMTFTIVYEDIPLQGGQFIKETGSIYYTVLFLQNTDWPEGQEVIDSFSLTE